MKRFRRLLLTSVMVALPGLAVAQSGATPKAADPGNCAMMDTSAMRKDMGAMMADMNGMMNSSSDPSQKSRMQKMHDQMGVMMANMQKMSGMMGGGMMGGGMMQGKKAPQGAPVPDKPDDHAAHHPDN